MNRLFNRSILNPITAYLLVILSLVIVDYSYADKQLSSAYKASSSKHPVALIELYTSQGCSSCPPAEKWLANLEKSGINKDKAVPLALHVDYWDYIGWKDQFSQKYFTQRQYQYRKTNHSDSVYTPQIMFNGNDVRRVTLNNSLDELRDKTAPVAFDVEATLHNANNLKLAINFNRIDSIAKNSRVVVVVAENNLEGDIKSGENSGRKLKHNHVVRVWKNLGQIRDKFAFDLEVKPRWNRDNLEVVVIVETTDMQTQQTLNLALK